MGRQAAAARHPLLAQLLPFMLLSPRAPPAVRLLVYTALLATVCLVLGLQLGLLAMSPAPLQPPSAPHVIAVTSEQSSSSLIVKTIVAYSLEAQLEQGPLPPCTVTNSPTPPHLPHRNNRVWQTPASISDTFLLSAYYDARLQLEGRAYPSVRVISMLYGNTNVSLFCQLWFKRGVPPVITRALRTEIWSEQWDASSYERVYRPFLLSCPISRAMERKIPYAVSVVEDEPCSDPRTFLPVLSSQAPTRPSGVAVCVKGLNFAEDRSIRLVEWLEANRLLGADRFFIYVYHVHPNMSRVLQYYKGLGDVEVIPITLPGHQPNTPNQRTNFLRTNLWQKRRNELIAYNDCLYRNLQSYQFVLPLDIDEVIVPVQTQTWGSMFRKFFQQHPSALHQYASFSVQNAYFLKNFGVRHDNNLPEYLHMLRYTERSANFSPEGHSVKSFVSTQTALTVFNHYALHALYPAMQSRFVLNTKQAQMNHYQEHCSPLLSTDCQDNFLRYHKQDLLLSRYRQPLQARVQLVLKNLKLI